MKFIEINLMYIRISIYEYMYIGMTVAFLMFSTLWLLRDSQISSVFHIQFE